jgi:DNA ligase 1
VPQRFSLYNRFMSPLADLVAVSQRVALTSGRRVKVRELADFLKTLGAEEIGPAVLYLSGEITQGKIGITYKALQAAAEVAASSGASLSILEVDQALGVVAEVRGSGSTARRAQVLQSLFARATEEEQRFLVRLIVGELRQGALAGVMIDSIAAAAQIPVAVVRRAAMYSKSLGAIARAALSEGLEAMTKFQLELFVPASPMLAQTAADAGEALQAIGKESAFEWKMDGARIQVHKLGDEVRIFTRALNDVTAAIPEIVEAVRILPATSLILDGEAIAFDLHDRPLPFQTTMRRFGRKLNVEAMRIALPIRAFFFDCLYVEGRSLVDETTRTRFDALANVVPEAMRVPRLMTSDEAAATAFYDAALHAGHEGLMAKSLDSTYEAGNRGASWFKIKRAHTLDLVVLAAEWGHGRRSGLLSNLHLGAHDPDTGDYVMLGKTFKGLTDAMLTWQTKELLAREIRRDRSTVYVRPELVVEIAFSDLQVSSRYPAGLALRLARVKRYRDDKTAEQADSMGSVRQIVAAQLGNA